jgi:hypothetical protein
MARWQLTAQLCDLLTLLDQRVLGGQQRVAFGLVIIGIRHWLTPGKGR